MADDSAPTKGGHKQAGEMSENTRRQYDANIRGILEKWEITTYQHAFPESIRPTSLGTSTISHLRGISRRVNLAEAQALFLAECKDSNGAPNTATFSNIHKIQKNLLDTEAANAAAQKIGQKNTGQKPKPRRRSTESLKKTASTPNVPHDLVAPSKSIPPPFKLGATPPSKNSGNDQLTKPHTKEVAVAKKTAAEGNGLEKSSRRQSAFGFLEAPQTVSKKRSGAVELDNAQQGDHQVAKKARKEESSAQNPIQASHASKLDDVTLALKPGKSLSEELFGDDDEEEVVKSFSASESFSDDLDKGFETLKALMEEAKVANEKMFGTSTTSSVKAEATLNQDKIAAPTTSASNGNDIEFNSKTPTLAPPVSKESLATLNPGELEITIPGLEGNTMIVDVNAAKHQKCAKRLSPVRRTNVKRTRQSSSSTMSSQSDGMEDCNTPMSKSNGFSVHDPEAETTAPKLAIVAPIANMGLAPRVTEKSIQQVETAIADKSTVVPQGPLLQTMATKADDPTDRFREHCGWISHGLREVLDTEKLYNLARPDQVGLAQDLNAAFETTMRHLESDIAWAFKKHGANI